MQDSITLVFPTKVRRKLDFYFKVNLEEREKKGVIVFIWGGVFCFCFGLLFVCWVWFCSGVLFCFVLFFTRMSQEEQLKHGVSLETLSK